jgi:hypothetical protein
MSMRLHHLLGLAASVAIGVGTGIAQADGPILPEIPREVVRVSVDSGIVQNNTTGEQIIFAQMVESPGAAWLRLRFDIAELAGDVRAGDASYLRITSAHDGAVQHLNPRTMSQWQNTSAYFNGDAVYIELFAFPGTGDNQIRITEVVAGLRGGNSTTSICGPTDDRVPSSSARSARLLPVGCTAWIIDDAKHCFLAAGHCPYYGGIDVVEFNVPMSEPDGTIVHPAPEDQYATDPESVQYTFTGIGNDWAYFGCFPNSQTGLTAYQAQGEYFILDDAPPPVNGQTIRITGYGVDSSPSSYNQIQQTNTGAYVTNAGSSISYTVDTTGGNSGSAVLNVDTGLAIGIHTNGGCTSGGGSNTGCSINNAGLQNALANPQGVCAVSLEFLFPDGRPDIVDPDGSTTMQVSIVGEGDDAMEPGTDRFHYNIGDGWVTTNMEDLGGDLYRATFPATDCLTVVQYYFSAETVSGELITEPSNAPGGAYQVTSATDTLIPFDDDAEADLGWTLGLPGDTASTGAWTREDPQGTGAQPENDHTPAPGTQCFITDGRSGSSIGTYDVDGGFTTLVSPIMDASGGDAYLTYWRWYSNDQGSAPNEDVMQIDISNDGGTTWQSLETVSENNNAWTLKSYRIADVITPTNQMQLRFIASDLGSGSIVEAGVDDVRIDVYECDESCLGDLNGDGMRDLADLGILLASYDVDDGGDIDGDGDTDLADLGALLSVYDTLCP